MTNGNGSKKTNKIVNSVKTMELRVHRFEDGSESLEVVAHEFMMVDEKKYLVDLLCEAIKIVMRTTKRSPKIKLAGMSILNRLINKRGKGAFGKGNVSGVEPIGG